MRLSRTRICPLVVVFMTCITVALAGENWTQFKFDSRHSGNVPDRSVTTPLGLIGAVPLTDAVFTAPVVKDGRVYVVDGAGVAFCIDGETLEVLWKFESRGGKANCNNVSSPALVGDFLHVGTMAGSYYVLEASSGKVVKEHRWGDPIFSTPVVANNRAYIATLGSRVYALNPDGNVCWGWDFLRDYRSFRGDRWNGADWVKHVERNKNQRRVKFRDLFCCTRNLAVHKNTVIVPAGGVVVWLEDKGQSVAFKAVSMPESKPMDSWRRATLGLAVGENGEVYKQWHILDNNGSVEILSFKDGQFKVGGVPGTRTGTGGAHMGVCSVSLRDKAVYRTRPQEGFGFCRHVLGRGRGGGYLGGYPAIAPPILLRDHGVYGGLDGSLYVVPLDGSKKVWSFKTAFGKAISAPVAVCDGRIYFGCDDGYLYVLGPNGRAPLPTKDLELWRIRSPLAGKWTDSRFDWFTSYGDWDNRNANNHGIKPPFKLKWVRRYKGSTKHSSTCGGGRMYTHTSEGQIFAVEQETGRQVWRRYFPGTRISWTSALYHKERLLIPQTGRKCFLRCLDAATGELLWEAPFSGSAGWLRQQPPVVYKNLAIYMFGTGKYRPDGGRGSWLFPEWKKDYYAEGHQPLVRACDLKTGKEVWTTNFSKFGEGGDGAGLCLMADRLYYSCFFGSATAKDGTRRPPGVTAALDPNTGKIIWSTTEYSTRGMSTISGRDGRLYLGGFFPHNANEKRPFVACLNAEDGSLIWKSGPIREARRVITVGEKYLFTHASKKRGYLIDKASGKALGDPVGYYKCCRFTISEPYLLAVNMDIYDLSNRNKLVSTGPPMDTCECIGAFVSNGRVMYTAHGFGMQASQVCGEEAAAFTAPWEVKGDAADKR